MKVLTAIDQPLASPARVAQSERESLRVALVQERWYSDPDVMKEALANGIQRAAKHGAKIVCLQELTLSPYFAVTADGLERWHSSAEDIETGPTYHFAAQMAKECDCYVHASLYERVHVKESQNSDDLRGYNTAICVSPDGKLVAKTRKVHIPVTAGYYEDQYFRAAPAAENPFPVYNILAANLGFPTCWDQWFPELARIYSLQGAEILVYPTAIGSEPDHPHFDTQPIWQQVIVANGITNGTFMVVPNRIGSEELAAGQKLTFYGSSFISDPYGRVLLQAPRDESAVLVADLDLDQRRDWLTLFPFLKTRRSDLYGFLTANSDHFLEQKS